MNRLCDILGMEIPILSAPMAGAAGPELVAAVCEAGGFGVAPLWTGDSETVRSGVADVRARTDRPFAVNINLSRDWEDQLTVCIEAGIPAVSLFWGMNGKAIARAKEAGLTVLFSVGSAREARQAAEAGADVIVAQGWEAGGHVWGQVATMALVPAVVDAVDVPVIAAGGIADGRGMAAAMLLGASGVWIGTRFLASTEATIHPTYRQAILDASEEATGWYADLYDLGWPDAPHRALENETSRRWRDSGAKPMGDRPDEGDVVGQRPNGDPVLRYQSYTPLDGTTGNVTDMSLWAGQGLAQVRDTKPAAEIVQDIFTEAKGVLKNGRMALD